MSTTIHTEHTSAQIQANAAALDYAAREAAHFAVTSDDPSEFVTEYLHAFARVLGEESAAQRGDGESFCLREILEGDWSALVDHARLLGVEFGDLPYEIHAELRAAYRAAALDAQ